MLFAPYKPLCLLLCAGLLLSACGGLDSAEKQQYTDELVSNMLSGMVFVEGGSFLMGDFGGKDGKSTRNYWLDKDTHPTHMVTLDSFSISAHKVSWKEFNQWLDIMGRPRTEPYEIIKNSKGNSRMSLPANDDYLASVDWQDAKDYCQWVGKQSGLPVDLPTEAQWEYAARSRGQFDLFATPDGTFYEEIKKSLTPLNQRPPNKLGLYDMSGNGRDWTNDWYDEGYYSRSPAKNPPGPDTGTDKVARGSSGPGLYNNLVFTRYKMAPVLTIITTSGNGFRCAVQSPEPVKKAGK